MKLNSITSIIATTALTTLVNGVPQKPLVGSESLQSLIKKEKLLEKAKYLQGIADRSNGTRKFGSPGHEETVKWIYDTIAATGYYNVELQPFNSSRVVYDKFTVTFSDGTKPGWIQGVTEPKEGHFDGDIVQVPNCKDESLLATSNKGKIAFILTGPDERTCGDAVNMVKKLKDAGAIGLIAVGGADGESPDNQPVVGFPSDVSALLPIMLINLSAGNNLAKSLSGSKVTATMDIIGYENKTITSYNVIAETKGGDHSKVITSGAHSDSVPAGPGINDDGSGIIAQMEIAIALAKYEVKNTFRWFWWSAEELGVIGSAYYADHLSQEERDKIVLHMDFDMLASPNFIYAVYDGSGENWAHAGPAGSAHLQETFNSFFRSQKITPRPYDLDGRSDYISFSKYGIPVGGIKTGAEKVKLANETALYGGETGKPYDKCYHQACDTVDNLNLEAWEMNTKCIADAVAKYAVSIDGIDFPRRNQGQDKGVETGKD